MALLKTEILINRNIEVTFNTFLNKFSQILMRLDPMILKIEKITEGNIDIGTKFRAYYATRGFGPYSEGSISLKKLDLNNIQPDPTSLSKEILLEVKEIKPLELFQIIRFENNSKSIETFFFVKMQEFSKIIYQVEFDSDSDNHIIKFIPKRFIYFWAKKVINNRLQNLKIIIENYLN